MNEQYTPTLRQLQPVRSRGVAPSYVDALGRIYVVNLEMSAERKQLFVVAIRDVSLDGENTFAAVNETLVLDHYRNGVREAHAMKARVVATFRRAKKRRSYHTLGMQLAKL